MSAKTVHKARLKAAKTASATAKRSSAAKKHVARAVKRKNP